MSHGIANYIQKAAMPIAILLIAGTAHAVPVLYGTSLNGGNENTPQISDLYEIDTATGAGTLIGSTGYAINDITFDASTNTLFGSTTVWNPAASNSLVKFDPVTGAATTIGSGFGTLTTVVSITANSAGELFGMTRGSNLVSIDAATGAATVIGAMNVPSFQNILAFDNADALIAVIVDIVFEIDTITADVGIPLGDFCVDPGAHGDIDPLSGLLYTMTPGFVQDSMILIGDLSTANITSVIDTNIDYLNALAFAEVVRVPEPSTLVLLMWAIAGLLVRRKVWCG